MCRKACSSPIYIWSSTTDLLACTWLLHYSVGSGVTRVLFFFTVKMFSAVLVMVLSHVTTNSMNLYLALHYSLGSS